MTDTSITKIKVKKLFLEFSINKFAKDPRFLEGFISEEQLE